MRMKNPYSQSIPFELPPIDQSVSEAARAIGVAFLEEQKQIARDAGLTELPACEIGSTFGVLRLPKVPL